MSKDSPKTFMVKAEKFVDGIPINPVMPKNFDDTPNDARPASHSKWWDVPFIRTTTVEELDAQYASRTDDYAEKARESWIEGRESWMKAWPSGTRYDVRCLDGGAWDRSTGWGMFATLEDAVRCAKEGPNRDSIPGRAIIANLEANAREIFRTQGGEPE